MPETTALCVHHWKIEPSRSSHSLGVCQHCGAEKHFANSLDGGSDEYNPHTDGATGWQKVSADKKRRALTL